MVEAALIPLREKYSDLEAQSRFPERRRKQVTILFADIVQTQLRLFPPDPEDARDIFDSALQRLFNL